jgi:hypothetical protein
VSGFPIWAHHHPVTPDRCLQSTKSGQNRNLLATGAQSRDVKGPLADPVLAAHVGRLRTELMLLQNPNNLLFGKALALRRLTLLKGPDSSSTWIKLRGQGQDANHCMVFRVIHPFLVTPPGP